MQNSKNHDINSLINQISQRINMTPDDLKKAILNGDINKIKSSMPKEKAQKFDTFLTNQEILNSTDINETINKFLNK